ncbi:CBU_0592 family membrane protein [Parasphingorhabdus flavimaris]|jgi:predicted membrane protein|uniref:Permease n=1 Tax=Parasphingorhabdus flavimaris TaxID=266812 RepID=A0ABX2MY83_9SPHN|nr:permease [Parasphingorhabdus flavimaris]NVD26415.1 permease [Parasphingorhabdus flavimaris]|tara:strand:- start:409 stop:669 length:261 start_codon:yes stop_codon:yes gene_type:complete
MLDGFTANVIGIAGSVMIVSAYAYNVYAPAVNAFVYNGTNLLGALLLTISLMVHFNLASFLLEMVWIAIALGGLWKAFRDRERQQS